MESQIESKLSSKRDWYTYLGQNRQYYMPPYEMVTKDFIKAILKGEKALLKMNKVNFCNAPHYDEIGVKALYAKIVSMPNMARYFPDKFPKGRKYMHAQVCSFLA